MFNNSKKRARCTDESVPMSNLANDFSAQISLASLASQDMSNSSSIALVNDEPLTATHNLEQQGHRETTAGENPGNFKKILELVIRHDITILDCLNAGSLSNRYTSKDIYSETLLTIADMVRDQIIEEVKDIGSCLVGHGHDGKCNKRCK